MVTNHDDAVFDHHPTPTRGFTETVNWALKHADFFPNIFDKVKQSHIDLQPYSREAIIWYYRQRT